MGLATNTSLGYHVIGPYTRDFKTSREIRGTFEETYKDERKVLHLLKHKVSLTPSSPPRQKGKGVRQREQDGDIYGRHFSTWYHCRIWLT
ncbi:hypothetical protein J6590_023984 [Homalodisca vitripennis]|nr:hypothetical protein J6590_023984 [Homalodisca vitripennis]